MTAPAGSNEAALRRADREWCRTTADEPLDDGRLAVLGRAVQLTRQPAETAELDQLRAEVADLRRERDHEHTEAVRAIGALEVARRERDTWESEYERVRDDKLEDIVDARHRHAWEWQPDLEPLPLPCSCGDPWPLDRPPDLATVVPLRQPKGSNR